MTEPEFKTSLINTDISSPLVSVIIPAYNAERYLAETVESVLSQTYKNFELIIVNDGSKDNTEEVAKRYVKDDRIKYHNKENGGVSLARNYGFKHSKGKYIAFLDADDLWVKDYLEKKITFIENNYNYDIVVGLSRAIDINSNKINQWFDALGNNVLEAITSFYVDCSTLPSNILCRRAIVEQINGFDPRVSNSADKLFYVMAARIGKIKVLNEILLYYRLHPDNMHNNFSLMVKDYRMFKEILKEKKLLTGPALKSYEAGLKRLYIASALHKKKFFTAIGFLIKGLLKHPIPLSSTLFSLELLSNVLFFLSYKFGVINMMIRINRFRGKIPILLFHRISIETNSIWPPLHPNNLRKILSLLGTKYRFVRLEDLFTKSKEELKDCCIVVFDDGFKDFKDFALPILKEYKVPTTVFLPANCIDNQETIWTSKVDSAILNTRLDKIEFDISGINYTFPLVTDQQKMRHAEKIKSLLTETPASQFYSNLDKILTLLGHENSQDPELMSWEDIDSCAEDIKLGSHGLNHIYLPSVDTEQELDHEISGSKEIISSKTGLKVNYLSYPIGGFTQEIIDKCKSHYEACFAVNNELADLNKIHDSDYKYRIPRFNIYDSSPYEVLCRINGFHQFFK